MASATRGRSEDQIGLKVDKCVTDLLIKAGVGTSVGVLFSLVLFKRKQWPTTLGLGLGIGMALSNCQHEFKELYPEKSVAIIAPESDGQPS